MQNSAQRKLKRLNKAKISSHFTTTFMWKERSTKTLKSQKKKTTEFFVILFMLVEQNKQNEKTPGRASHQLHIKKNITKLTKSQRPKSRTHQIKTLRNIDKPTIRTWRGITKEKSKRTHYINPKKSNRKKKNPLWLYNFIHFHQRSQVKEKTLHGVSHQLCDKRC